MKTIKLKPMLTEVLTIELQDSDLNLVITDQNSAILSFNSNPVELFHLLQLIQELKIVINEEDNSIGIVVKNPYLLRYKNKCLSIVLQENKWVLE